VARDEERLPFCRKPLEEPPQVTAQDRVQTDGGLVEDEELRFADQGAGEGGPGTLSAREVAGDGAGVAREVDLGEGAVDGIGRGAEHPGEVADVVPDGEVVVEARRLGHVADRATERRRAGWPAEDGHRAAGDDLDTDDRPDQRRLARAGGAQQSDDLTPRDGDAEVGQHVAPTADDMESLDHDGGAVDFIHHVLKYSPLSMRSQTGSAHSYALVSWRPP